MDFNRASLLFAGLTCAALSSACRGSTPSDTVPTGDIVAAIDVYDDGYGSVITTVDLLDRVHNTSIRLAGDDRLVATFGNQSASMEGSAGIYQADFPFSNAGDVTVAFDRSKYDSAPDSYGVLPDVLAPGSFEGLVISRGLDTIVLEIPQTAFDKTVDLTGPCVSGLSFDLGADAADVVVYPGDLYSSGSSSECNVTITLTSISYGSPDPAFHPDSTFVLSRARSTSFYSIP